MLGSAAPSSPDHPCKTRTHSTNFCNARRHTLILPKRSARKQFIRQACCWDWKAMTAFESAWGIALCLFNRVLLLAFVCRLLAASNSISSSRHAYGNCLSLFQKNSSTKKKAGNGQKSVLVLPLCGAGLPLLIVFSHGTAHLPTV